MVIEGMAPSETSLSLMIHHSFSTFFCSLNNRLLPPLHPLSVRADVIGIFHIFLSATLIQEVPSVNW